MTARSGRWTAAVAVLLSGTAASAQVGADTGGATRTASAAPVSGSPTNGTATVSPATIADAAQRVDDRQADGTGPRFGVSLGSSVASGDFGTGQASRIWSTALGARVAIGTLRLTASVPYLNIRGRGLIFSGIDSTPIIAAGGTPGRKVTHDGLGDASFGAAYTLPLGDGRPEIELSGRIKVPTATDASQLSTGKTDYSAGVQVTQQIGRFAPFVSGTYRIFGDPAGLDLRDGFAASAGTSIGLGGSAVALLSYHYARAATRLVRDSHELFAGASARLPHSPLRATAFATAGVSTGAAAASGGVSLALDL